MLIFGKMKSFIEVAKKKKNGSLVLKCMWIKNCDLSFLISHMPRLPLRLCLYFFFYRLMAFFSTESTDANPIGGMYDCQNDTEPFKYENIDCLSCCRRLLNCSENMAVTFANLSAASGLQKLNDYLLTRSYITGYQASKDDIAVYAALNTPPSSEYVNAARWYNHIDALLRLSGISEEGNGVKIESTATLLEEIPATPAVVDKAPADEDDDDDVDLFGEETEEEKKAAEERAAAVKASSKKKESGKSSVLLDVKPWDDETDMKKLEEAVRSIQMEGLLWGASKLVPVGYGIKKLQIMMTIVDDLVSVDSLIEEYLCVEPANEYIQSCDIVAFNKI